MIIMVLPSPWCFHNMIRSKYVCVCVCVYAPIIHKNISDFRHKSFQGNMFYCLEKFLNLQDIYWFTNFAAPHSVELICTSPIM